MIELQGKYNKCKVFTNNIDNETISQLINLLNQEFVKIIRSVLCRTLMLEKAV